jgi:hypothetical protein
MSNSPQNNFQSDGIAWRFQQAQRQFGEWFEQWLNQPKQGRTQAPSQNWEWLQQLILILVVAGLMVGLGVLLWRGYVALRSRQLAKRLARLNQPDATPPPLNLNEWLLQAQQQQQQGNYAEACRSLYWAMLQLLNDRGIIPHRLSLTNGEYRHLVQQLSSASACQTLLQTHNQVHFGGDSASIEAYQQCQKAYQTLNQQLPQQILNQPNSDNAPRKSS